MESNGTMCGTYDGLVWLGEGALPRRLIGGKAASLQQLMEIGAQVPTAFVLTTDVYLDVAERLDIPKDARAVAEADLPTLQSRLLESAFTGGLRASVRAAFERMQGESGPGLAVAVRSSAAAEDSRAHSFAGLHDTVLDVRTAEHLEQAIKQCWASLWTARALAYRQEIGLAEEAGGIAVVVQRMVRSDVSFVAFTANPIDGRMDRTVINATWGLGEALVSGSVTPDHIELATDGRGRSYDVADKARMVVPGAGDGTGAKEMEVPRFLRRARTLSDEWVTTIAAEAQRVAGRLGYAADIEGGIAGERLFLFQARPITTLLAAAMVA